MTNPRSLFGRLACAIVLFTALACGTFSHAYEAIFTPSANTVYQVDESTYGTFARYTIKTDVSISSALTISGGQTGTAILEISADGSTDWIEKARVSSDQSGTLVIGVAITQTNIIPLVGHATYDCQYFRIRTTGTATVTLGTCEIVWGPN